MRCCCPQCHNMQEAHASGWACKTWALSPALVMAGRWYKSFQEMILTLEIPGDGAQMS